MFRSSWFAVSGIKQVVTALGHFHQRAAAGFLDFVLCDGGDASRRSANLLPMLGTPYLGSLLDERQEAHKASASSGGGWLTRNPVSAPGARL